MANIVERPLRSGIYLSYRPEDSYGHVQALLPALRQRFGSRLTVDPDDLATNPSPSPDIRSLLEPCAVMLAVIGRDWLAVRETAAPKRRFLDDSSDGLRRLLAAALTNEEILVIPVLVAGASLPRANDLPAELEPIALRQAVQLRGSRWDVDVERLVRLTESAVARVPIDWHLEPDASESGFDLDIVEAQRTRRIAECLHSAHRTFEADDYAAALSASEEVLALNPYHSEARDLARRARSARDRPAIQRLLARANDKLQRADLEAASALLNQAHALDLSHEGAAAIEELRAQLEDMERARRQDLERRHEAEDTATDDAQKRAAADAERRAAEGRARMDENVQFTVYRRSVVQPARWYPLLAFAHLAEKRSDARPDELDPVREVQAQARQVLGESADAFQALTSDSRSEVMRDGELRFVPQVEGVEFNPTERRFIWSESVHREEFRMRAAPSMDGKIARGVLTVYAGNLLLADVPLAIRVDKDSRDAREEHSEARPYRRIFASYSHRDRSIVEEFEAHARATGDSYLRDVVSLRAGELWNDRLLEMIDKADVFQLFWSWNAMASQVVHKEWRYALDLGRTHFVRPVYWEEPLPERPGLPPDALRSLHFQRVYPRAASSAIQEPSISTTSPPAPTRSPAPVTPRSAGGLRHKSRRAPMTRVLRFAALAAPVLAVTVYLATLHRGAAPPLQPVPPSPVGVPPSGPDAGSEPVVRPTVPPAPPPAPPAPPPAPPSVPAVTPRAAGTAALAVDELSVRGIVKSRGEFLAMVQDQNGKMYTVRQGDKLADGTVKAVNADGLVIIQETRDPLSPVKQREVIKRVRSQ
jgi:TIR domain-containing protein